MKTLGEELKALGHRVTELESESTVTARDDARSLAGSRMDQAIDRIAEANQAAERKPAKAAEALRHCAAEALAAARILDAL